MQHFDCVCGKRFTDERFLTRHVAQCKTVLERREKAFKNLNRSRHDTPGIPPKRSLDAMQSNGAFADMLRSTLGLGKRRRLSKKQDAPLTGAPSSSLDDHSLSTSSHSQPSGSHSASSVHPFPDDEWNVNVEPDAPVNLTLPPSPKLPPKRVRFFTWKKQAAQPEPLPEGPGPLAETEAPTEPDEQASTPIILRVPRVFRTIANAFNLSRLYRHRPTRVPDADATFADMLSDHIQAHRTPRQKRTIADIIAPYPNLSAFKLGNWFATERTLNQSSRKRLLDDVFFGPGPDFSLRDLEDVNWEALDRTIVEDAGGAVEGNGWRNTTVYIDVPTGKKLTKATRLNHKKKVAAARREHDLDSDSSQSDYAPEELRTFMKFPVHGFHHRSLTHIIKEVWSAEESCDFHHHPFEHYWHPPWEGATPERVYSELYTAQAFLDADQALQNSPLEPGCDLPRVIAPLMIWSDATQVSQFGQAKLWPGYVFSGSQSKYDRARPSCGGAHHFAYFPSLPDSINDFLRAHTQGATSPLLTHCRRELFHGCWSIILDDEFLEAYRHGIVILCSDGVRRRVYPRIFTYSADYPEKVLIATIRDKGTCLCPRCKVKKGDVHHMGTASDRATREETKRVDDDNRRQAVQSARDLILKKGIVVNGQRVEALLSPDSLVPTQNAFSARLSQFGFDFFLMLVIDLMHEFELGVWKAVLIHLIRMLHAEGEDAVREFNRRFRQVAPFGRDTIRKFTADVSELKKLAARDFEDILQCCMPCFEGLFSAPHDSTVQDLLYILAYWHSLAKLRMHTESSLKLLDTVTTTLGDAMRFFADETCRHFETFELDKEYRARGRAAARRYTRAGGTGAPPPLSGKKPRSYNLDTPKFHFLGDYPQQIRFVGTSDGISTQTGELQHRVTKGLNNRTNHNNAVPQIIKHDVHRNIHARIMTELRPLLYDSNSDEDDAEVDDEDIGTATANMDEKYHIASVDEKHKVYLDELVRKGDPAFQNYIPRLKSHLVRRHRGDNYDGVETVLDDSELDGVIIQHNRIYAHATARFNYTTYDVRRDQDTINTNTRRRDILLRSYEDEDDADGHPYWYARVLGVYHARVFFPNSRTPKRMDFLFVRWFGRDPEWVGGPRSLRLDRIGFVPHDSPDPFGFVDPANVIRGCHLIPTFALGKTVDLLPPSFARDSSEGDWVNYYVMRFVDRDMMMRYLGLGVGHHQPSDFPREDSVLRKVPEGSSYVYTDWDVAEEEDECEIAASHGDKEMDSDGKEDNEEDDRDEDEDEDEDKSGQDDTSSVDDEDEVEEGEGYEY